MTATHATRVTDLRPRVDRRAEVDLARADLNATIVYIHSAEHAGVRLATCANPICAALRHVLEVAS